MSDPKSLTRQELSVILNNDQRAIRAFEKLFELIPSELEINSTSSNNSNSKSVQGISMSSEALRLVKGSNVLLWLSI